MAVVRDNVTRAKKAAFLAAFAKCGIISMACRQADVSRKIYYVWMEHDPDFVVQVGHARAEAADYIEALAMERATVGHQVVKEIWEPGPDGPVCTRREVSQHVSDTMLAMMLNGAKPEKYKTRVDATVSVLAPKVVAREFYEAV